MRLEVLSSTPPSPTEGSGTWVGIDSLRRGLERLGHAVTVRPLGARTGFHTLDRYRYNRAVARRPPEADLVVGVDLDGFLWAERRGAIRYVVTLKGIVADELRNERGIVRMLLAVQARWERANALRADRVVVPSRYSAAIAEDVYAVPKDRLAVVPEAIDVAEWRRRFAEAPAARAPHPTVLAVARMYPRKRLGDLLEAAALCRARIPGLRVRIVGEGPEAAALRRRSRALRLDDVVTFLGEVPRQALAVEYVGADVFCLPTVQESFGLVFAEAMVAGLPVVACRAAAVPEVVEDRRTGLLVNPRSPDELAMAMETLLTNPGLRAQLGEAGRRRAEALDLGPVAARFLEAVRP